MDDNWLTDWLTNLLIDDKIMITKSVIIPAVSGLYRPAGFLFLIDVGCMACVINYTLSYVDVIDYPWSG